MRMTLLEMVQNILSALDSDNVDSITDTVESIQVAELVRESYFYITSKKDWPFAKQLFQFEGLADVNNPTKMRMPNNINKVFWVQYNKKDVTYLDPAEFLSIINGREEQTGVIDANGYGINRDPVFWTTFDDKHVLFDSRDNTTDDTLMASKTKVYGTRAEAWEHVDGYVPDIPDKFFPTLLAEAKAQAFVNLKQQSNLREEAKAKRGLVAMQNESWRNENGETKYNRRVDYGRK